ncbi:MAG: Chromosomal replication initiator protein DnaA [Candidatus Nomurabacteria bacterium GW2011_GWB1_37_5]|uniref:Chromosomal replication initiator protein DnaA n=1 Tax=Candidatus Nomurabacteria bacterium GW2011_GWB1_37_5 TaxID=1618742 RepID=A0A0G0K5F6_9BACT|nr:MAG: Chromosomal replication initiator protein DnaA [Candidatus Nomurabacteria bacterium GW2011_GWB1_37_5]
MDNKQLWDNCLIEIESNVSKANFSTWFRNTSVLKEDAGTIYLSVPNEFVKDWLLNKFHKLILKTFRNFQESTRSVEYIITKEDFKLKNNDSFTENKILINKELPLNNLYIDKESNLNPRYHFESFIVGPFNELPYAAGQAIINNPGQIYNPFFIYGGTGLGKTHLIQSIGNSIKSKFGQNRVFYTTLERFAVDYVNSVQNNKVNAFKEKYRNYDTIIIDDIQFVGKMEKTQEELFHLFNDYHEKGRQIIFSSDKHPNYIPGLEDRLKSRFSAGMIVDISPPEYESRLAILKEKSKESNVILPDEIIEYLASIIEGNIRELEGSLNAVICQTRLKNKNLNITDVKNLIKNNIKPKKNVSIKDVVKIISNFYNISEESLYEKTRRKEIVKARQLVMFILREDFNVSYPLIGQKLGGKDHTTVIHSCAKIKNDLKNNTLLIQELEQIRSIFK